MLPKARWVDLGQSWWEDNEHGGSGTVDVAYCVTANHPEVRKEIKEGLTDFERHPSDRSRYSAHSLIITPAS